MTFFNWSGSNGGGNGGDMVSSQIWIYIVFTVSFYSSYSWNLVLLCYLASIENNKI